MDPNQTQSVSAVERRWQDRLLQWAVLLVGALSAILWGILWSNVSSAQYRLSTVEARQGIYEVQYKELKETLNEIKAELRAQRR